MPKNPTAPRLSGVPLPGADCLQSVSGNSGALDTLDSKLLVPANFQSSCSPRSFEQLESGAWHSELRYLNQTCNSKLFLALR